MTNGTRGQAWCAGCLQLERALIKRYLEPRPGERLLDIGSGTGIHLEWFRELGLQVTGLDASPYMLEQARSRLRGGADLHLGWAEHLPFEDNEFDLATLINTLEFAEDPEKALAEAFRVTNRRVVLGVLNKYALMAMHRRLRGLLEDTIYCQARFFSVWELKEMIKKIMGPISIQWGTALFFPPTLGKITRSVEHHPFFPAKSLGRLYCDESGHKLPIYHLQRPPQDAAAQETWPTASGQPQGIFAAACVERETPTRSYSAPMTADSATRGHGETEKRRKTKLTVYSKNIVESLFSNSSKYMYHLYMNKA